MLRSLLLIFFVLVGNSAAQETPVILKSVSLNFDPTEVFLVEEISGNKLRTMPISFRIISQSEEVRNVTTVGLVPNGSRAVAILFTNFNELDPKAESREITGADLFDIGIAERLRTEILEKRLRFAELEKERARVQNDLGSLKQKAASMARLNRLVEAQTTAKDLSARLDGLNKDRANVEKLLRIIRNQPSSVRLANTEAALSRDLRLLSQEGAGANRNKQLLLSDAKREAALRIIEQTRGEDLDSLRRQVRAVRELGSRSNSHSIENDLNREQDFEVGRDD